MDIRDLPIPPRPDYFGPDGAPPGIGLALDTWDRDVGGQPWYATRPLGRKRGALVHTNAANAEGSRASQERWGNSSTNRTKPHYLINEGPSLYSDQVGPVKVLRSDARAIANATPSWYEEQTGEIDCSYWLIAIETADDGTADGGVGDFLVAGRSEFGPVEVPHAELVARVFAYESIVHDFYCTVLNPWNGSGIATHTWPFPYPAFTTVAGKTCPGPQKKATFREQIVPRAQAIRAAWLAPPTPPEEDDMGQINYIRLRFRDETGRLFDDQAMALPIGSREALIKLDADDDRLFTATIDATRAELEAELGFRLTPS